MKSKLFKIAHAIKSDYETFGEALKQAWKVIKIWMKMRAGNASFKFRKVSGEIRSAIGTLTVSYESKGTGRPVPHDSVMYFDVESDGFRSFKSVNLL